MPILYSLEIDTDAGDAVLPTERHWLTSQVKAEKMAREQTDTDAEGVVRRGVVRCHKTQTANMDAILEALTGTGWASLDTAERVSSFTNGKKDR